MNQICFCQRQMIGNPGRTEHLITHRNYLEKSQHYREGLDKAFQASLQGQLQGMQQFTYPYNSVQTSFFGFCLTTQEDLVADITGQN